MAGEHIFFSPPFLKFLGAIFFPLSQQFLLKCSDV